MTLDLITERDAELQKCSAGYGRARVIGKGGEIGLGTVKSRIEAAGIDRGAMSVPCVVSTQDEDNSLDIIVTAGIDLTIHEANPVVKFDHGQSLSLPIGKAQDSQGLYTVTRGDGFLKAVTFFSQTNLEAEQIFQLIEEGILNGVSIGAIPLPDKIEKRNVINWKGLAGLRVLGCRMFEYSHTPSPDNSRALTERTQGGRMLAGKSLSPALYKSLSPFLIAEPTQVTVPALAAELVKELQKGGLTVGTAAVPIKKTDDPNAPGYQPVEQTPAAGATTDTNKPADDPTKDYPPGAKAIAGDYDRLMERCDYVTSMSKGQEHPAVKAYLAQKSESLAAEAEELKALWKEHYADLPELGGKANVDGKGLAQVLLPYRKSILAGIPAATARDEKLTKAEAATATLTNENVELRKALGDSLDREDKIRAAYRKLRMGQ